MDGHKLVAHTLKSLGISHIYSLSGGAIRQTLPACSQIGIRAIGVRHQQAAVLMAAAHNYRAGRLMAVAMVSAGPAVTNAATGILVAWDNRWPLLIIAGIPPLSQSRVHGREAFQAVDGISLFQTITKSSIQVQSSSEISQLLTKGFQVAISDQPGPVYLEIPECALEKTSALPSMTETSSQSACTGPINSENFGRASQVLLDSRRPAVILGKGLRWTEASDEIRFLIDTYQIPFITSPMGRGYLPDDHPLCFNAARDALQIKADTIIILGARLNWTFRFGKQFNRHAVLIHIDIATEELGRNFPHSIGLKGDIKHVLKELFDSLKRRDTKPHNVHDRETWLEYLRNVRDAQKCRLETQISHSTFPMSPHRLMKEIRDFLPRDAICVLDGRDTMAVAQEVLLSYEPASRFTAGSNGCMGVGIPFGLGAKLSTPDHMVVVVTGDMAFGIAAMEMETAVRHKIPIIVIVVNNDGGCATSVHRSLYPADHEPVAMFQPRLRYEKIMEACGGYAESVDQPEHIQPALRRAVESGIPACLNVYVDPNAPFKNYLG
ncbi:MAG: thiamine pyrophosphate-binding protein [Nitrospirales bacterium]